MAILKSILSHKGSGKIGNTIIQYYNKKTIVRSLNTSISNIPSAAQISIRNKFKNTQRAYDFKKDFFSFLLPIFKNNTNIKNYFFKLYLSSAQVYDNVISYGCWLSLVDLYPTTNVKMNITAVFPREDNTNFKGTWIYFNILYSQTNAPVFLIINRMRDDNFEYENLIFELEIGQIQLGRFYLAAVNTFNFNVSCYLLSVSNKTFSNIFKVTVLD